MKILLVDDDPEIIASLSGFLKENGLIIDTADNGDKASVLSLVNDYDAIVLDQNLPQMSGREIVRRLRQEGKTTPVIMLTVRSSLEDKVEALDDGADDYLTKPFLLRELLARIKAITRRPARITPEVLIVRNIELDSGRFSVKKNGREIKLRAREFSLLEYLMKNSGRLLSRQEILDHVWDENTDPFSNTIEVHIMNLRKKLENKKERFIATISNRGYKFE